MSSTHRDDHRDGPFFACFVPHPAEVADASSLDRESQVAPVSLLQIDFISGCVSDRMSDEWEQTSAMRFVNRLAPA